MAKLVIRAEINLQGLIDTCTAIPQVLDAEPKFDLVCKFSGGEMGCETIQEVVEMVRELIKRSKLAKVGVSSG